MPLYVRSAQRSLARFPVHISVQYFHNFVLLCSSDTLLGRSSSAIPDPDPDPDPDPPPPPPPLWPHRFITIARYCRLTPVPQDPSHSAENLIVLRCSKLSCGMEYQLSGDGIWHQWDATDAVVEHSHRSRAPTPAPALGALVPSAYSGENGSGDDDQNDGGDGNGNGDGEQGYGGMGAGDEGAEGDEAEDSSEEDDDDDDGSGDGEDEVTVDITAEQVRGLFPYFLVCPTASVQLRVRACVRTCP